MYEHDFFKKNIGFAFERYELKVNKSNYTYKDDRAKIRYSKITREIRS